MFSGMDKCYILYLLIFLVLHAVALCAPIDVFTILTFIYKPSCLMGDPVCPNYWKKIGFKFRKSAKRQVSINRNWFNKNLVFWVFQENSNISEKWAINPLCGRNMVHATGNPSKVVVWLVQRSYNGRAY